MLKKGRGLTHARKTAAKAASAATAMELPTVLAAPVKGAMKGTFSFTASGIAAMLVGVPM